MSYINYYLMNTKISVGPGAVEELSKALKELKVKKPLIVTDENIYANYYSNIVEPVTKLVDDYAIYHGVNPDPYDYMVEEGLKVFKENACDCVIGLGGGSSMDCAKCVAIMVTHDISEAISMADKIIVMSKRPSTIKSIYDIKLTNKSNPINNRKCKEFSEYYEKIWKDLDFHV